MGKGLQQFRKGCVIKLFSSPTTQVVCVSSFSQTLRRYTSLNHLAQAARAVLQNSAQINQMLSDLNRVDFSNVQVTTACICVCVCVFVSVYGYLCLFLCLCQCPCLCLCLVSVSLCLCVCLGKCVSMSMCFCLSECGCVRMCVSVLSVSIFEPVCV